jgi:creatinine amidohydrolase
MSLTSHKAALLRPDQILEEIRRCPLAYIPIGPLEWHGPHLPVGTDAIHAEQSAELAAQETGGLVLPTLYWGTERERSPEVLGWLGFDPDQWVVGMDFPANSLPSLYASEEVFALLVREQLRMAATWGFRLIVLITGHGAENQIAVLERLAAEFSAAGPAKVLVALPFVTNSQGIMEVGHASRIETSVMLAMHPELVNQEALPPLPKPLQNTDWAIVDYETFLGNPTPERTVHAEDDPRRANAETGRVILQKAAAQIAERVKKVLND